MRSANYSLRQIVDMTGVSEFTLRGWESRYRAFTPKRTETGRRRYSDKDLQKAILLRELVNRDHRIGEIAHLSLREIHELMGSHANEGSPEQSRTASNRQIEKVLNFASLQEWSQLESAIRGSVKKLKPLDAIENFILPLLEAVGREVAERRLGIAQEHVLSALVKQTLNGFISHRVNLSDTKFVIATPEGDFHELGILAAHSIATQLKVTSLYLGPNTPKRELCETVARFSPTHLLIGSTVSKNEGAGEDFYSFVHYLDQNVPRQVAFWFGGRSCQPLELKRDVRMFSSLVQFRKELQDLAMSGKKNAKK